VRRSLIVAELSALHQDLVDAVPLAPAARIVEATVAYQHQGQALEGYAVHDAAIIERKPAVLVIHDWSRLREYPRARAQMLARLGYYAFAVDLYGVGRRFDDRDEAAAEAARYYRDLELLRARVQAGYDQAVADPAVDPERVAVVGYCFGGSAALEFARTGAQLSGVVSFHGGLIAHDPPGVEAITAELLIATGGSDPVVPDESVVAFQNELRTRPDLRWQITTYSGAPHAFTLPGTPNYRPVADRRSWRESVAFLREVLSA
jgi:dienelactone hydrolase